MMQESTGQDRTGSPELRASDAEREQVIALLREHCVAGRLSFDDLAQRARSVYAAETRGDLQAVTQDLPAIPTPAPSPAPMSVATPQGRVRRGIEWTIAIMSGQQRRGRWRVHERTNVIACMGGCTLDLRQALLDGPELEVNAFALMGSIDIIVPEGIEVELQGFAFMGGRHCDVGDEPPLPGTPFVRVNAFACMGGINVKSRQSGEALPREFDEEDIYADDRHRRRERRRARR